MLAWLLVLHVLGVILWVAGAFAAGRVLLDHARAGAQGAAFVPTERSLLLKTAHPGMTLALATGAAALALNSGYYLHEGWMHAKLAATALAVAATVVLTVASRRMSAAHDAVGERALTLWRGLLMGAVLAALVLVFVKPL
ncbi:MAG: CopD family protein [Elusimicrobia bacterium]|nr:CopD family protein [Elusimicrobiota bacterium]